MEEREGRIETWRKEKAGMRIKSWGKEAGLRLAVKEKAGFRLGGTKRLGSDLEEREGGIQTGRKEKAGSRPGGKRSRIQTGRKEKAAFRSAEDTKVGFIFQEASKLRV